jgi:hypothetical protein
MSSSSIVVLKQFLLRVSGSRGIVVCYSLAFHKHLGGKTAEIISIFRNRCINKGKEVTCNGVGVGTVRDLGGCR